jgi:asparaginyl-tRNA synthetase
VIAQSASGEEAINSRISKDTDPSILLDLRHLTLRGETASAIMLVRDAVEHAFNTAYYELRLRKVSSSFFNLPGT